MLAPCVSLLIVFPSHTLTHLLALLPRPFWKQLLDMCGMEKVAAEARATLQRLQGSG